MTTKMPTKAKV